MTVCVAPLPLLPMVAVAVGMYDPIEPYEATHSNESSVRSHSLK